MAGPIHKPLPVFSPADAQAREEIERLMALEDARIDQEERFWTGLEARAEAAEFLAIGDADIERVEAEWTRMEEGSPERRSYDEWGVVK